MHAAARSSYTAPPPAPLPDAAWAQAADSFQTRTALPFITLREPYFVGPVEAATRPLHASQCMLQFIINEHRALQVPCALCAGC